MWKHLYNRKSGETFKIFITITARISTDTVIIINTAITAIMSTLTAVIIIRKIIVIIITITSYSWLCNPSELY